jgi:hypothetical protein
MKTRTITILIILVAIAAGFGVTLLSGIYEQTSDPANFFAVTMQVWGGFPFGWWGYSQSTHVYFVNPPHWFSLASFLSDIVFWFLISSASAFITLRFVRMKRESRLNATKF